ncbi:hypothetical protein LTR84_004263 [Exophiala bonariae]|uniref:Carboxypeptidase M14B n=1 Tax=Exophiala bonariae TaxID=1690606 RepID=A0AAV9N4F7_9EURO|nr:hypothetical protein LTR84_004263 [Exophiala bonariae]
MPRKPKNYGYNAPFVIKDNPVIAGHFPDPGISLLSPAFRSPKTIPATFGNGTSGPTEDLVLDQFLDELDGRNDCMTYDKTTLRSEEGRNIPYVVLSASSKPTRSLPKDPRKLRLWIQGATHGDEPASDQSILALLGKLDTNPGQTLSMLQNLDILIVPRYNPDGVAYFQRRFATNFDPARDHIRLRSAQTRSIKSLFNSFAPHVAVDMHEFSAKARYAERYVRILDGQFAVGKNLNIHSDIRALSEELFVKSIATALEDAGLRWAPYSTGLRDAAADGLLNFSEAGSEACITRNAWGLTQTVAILCETRGIGIADQHFARRTFTGLKMLEAIISTTVQHADEIHLKLEGASQSFITSKEDIIITDIPEMVDCTLPFFDLRTNNLVDVPTTLKSTTKLRPQFSRKRPRAYLIPKAWSELTSRLEANGIEVQTLDHAFSGEVEILKVTSVEIDTEYDEGCIRANITTRPIMKHVRLPLGSFSVNTVQKRAGLAFMALEPESVDSFATMNIIPLVTGDEYPIFRQLWN